MSILQDDSSTEIWLARLGAIRTTKTTLSRLRELRAALA